MDNQKVIGDRKNKILQEWSSLSEDKKSLLIPSLLAATGEWRAWSFSERSILLWLSEKFKKAGVPFLI